MPRNVCCYIDHQSFPSGLPNIMSGLLYVSILVTQVATKALTYVCSTALKSTVAIYMFYQVHRAGSQPSLSVCLSVCLISFAILLSIWLLHGSNIQQELVNSHLWIKIQTKHIDLETSFNNYCTYLVGKPLNWQSTLFNSLF